MSCRDFRRPKLPSSHYELNESIQPDTSDTRGVDDLQTSGRSTYSIKPNIPTKLDVPVFSKRKIRDVQIAGALKAEGEMKSGKENIKIRMEQGKSLPKKPRENNCKSMTATAVNLPKQKRVPDCSQQSRLSKVSHDTCHVITESALSINQPPQDKSQRAEVSIKHQEQLFTSKTKDRNAQKMATATGEKKSARGEKKTIDSETNQKKVLSKHAVGKLSDLTVPELKAFLSENKAKISGKKEELVRRVILLLSSPQSEE